MTSSPCLAILAACLHSLDLHYPSQRAYFDLLKSLPPSIPLRKDHQLWLRELSCSLRRGGYSQFRRLTQMSSLVRLVAPEMHDQVGSFHPVPDLVLLSLQTLVANLRHHLRLNAWCMIRSAYREFTPSISDTSAWLSDVLLLEVETGKQDSRGESNHVELWFVSREKLGEVGRKEDHARWAVKTKK
jgi:hypothetical protein